MSDRFKRIIAFIIDWTLSILPAFFMLLPLAVLSIQMTWLLMVFIILIGFSPIILFVLRDVIFNGRSLGKRIFGLCVYDKKSLGASSSKQRLLRNIFLFIYPIDGIILISTGESIGDRAAGTVVLSEASLERCKEERAHSGIPVPLSKKEKRKRALIITSIVVCCLLVFIVPVLIALNATKNTEEYKLAYDYLISSNAYKEMDADESDIHISSFSSQSHPYENSDHVSKTASIGFVVRYKSFEVVCHYDDGVWQVCDECTGFD
ncbi:MAG: RDD family protein [Oscillospiraceae bacterium]